MECGAYWIWVEFLVKKTYQSPVLAEFVADCSFSKQHVPPVAKESLVDQNNTLSTPSVENKPWSSPGKLILELVFY